MPNDHYSVRTAPLTSKGCILCIYSTNIVTEYFEHGIYCSFFFSSKCSLFHNSNVFGFCITHNLYTGCAKIKKKTIPAPEGSEVIIWNIAAFTSVLNPGNYRRIHLKIHIAV